MKHFISSTNMTKILLVRHAMTDTAGKSLSGRTPGILLNEEGRQQLKKLVEKLAIIPLSAVYSSPLERALETASPISESHHLSSIVSEDFLEIDFGKWTNHSIEELKNSQSFQHFNTFRSGTRIPEGELFAEAQLRMVKGIEKIAGANKNKVVAIISHADMIRLAIAYYSGVPLDMMQRFEISPASVSILEIYDYTAKIALVNGNSEMF